MKHLFKVLVAGLIAIGCGDYGSETEDVEFGQARLASVGAQWVDNPIFRLRVEAAQYTKCTMSTLTEPCQTSGTWNAISATSYGGSVQNAVTRIFGITSAPMPPPAARSRQGVWEIESCNGFCAQLDSNNRRYDLIIRPPFSLSSQPNAMGSYSQVISGNKIAGAEIALNNTFIATRVARGLGTDQNWRRWGVCRLMGVAHGLLASLTSTTNSCLAAFPTTEQELFDRLGYTSSEMIDIGVMYRSRKECLGCAGEL